MFYLYPLPPHQEFSCNSIKVMFTFSVTRRKALCVSLRSNKHIECNSSLISYLKCVIFNRWCIVYFNLCLLAVFFATFVWALPSLLVHYRHHHQLSVRNIPWNWHPTCAHVRPRVFAGYKLSRDPLIKKFLYCATSMILVWVYLHVFYSGCRDKREYIYCTSIGVYVCFPSSPYLHGGDQQQLEV